MRLGSGCDVRGAVSDEATSQEVSARRSVVARGINVLEGGLA